MPWYPRYIKTFLDLLLSVPAFIVFLPLMMIVTILLCFANTGKPFFLQQRPGKMGKIFWLVKFKTMNDRKDADGKLLPDEKRLTTIGKWIRKYSIDELPQLINVIRGDMSIIGPRPLLVEYLKLYTPLQNRRHEVKPGITGWAQVNGRNALGWSEKFELDVWYVDHISFLLDLKILIMTIRKIIIADDISNSGHATMPHFKGADSL